MINLMIYFNIFLFFWLLVLTVFFLKLRSHYLNLIKKTRKERLDEMLDSLLEKDKVNVLAINQLKEELKNLKELSQYHFQKVGLLRFNPFERSGGEQSFVLTLLDNLNNGLVLNFIYTREGLRVYTKKVKEGKGVEYDLTEEEKKAIEKAIK